MAELRTRREEIRQELGLVPGTPALFAIGRLVELKGFDQLIRAMAKLERPARLYLAGDGPQEEQLRSLIAELSLEDRVVLLGEQTPEQVQQWLAAADWFVHPARRDCSPLVTVEAANAGVPMILSTQTGNTPEAVEEGVNGFTFDVDDLDSLVGALNEALSLPQDRVDEMGQESLRIAEEKFDPDTVVHDFFKTLLHDKTPNTAPSSPK
ncbi:MAG: glycosyltransferase [Phycisphaerales bacterium]|nr:glycosyltransferase [Phycisphaerales bacterium]